MRTGMSKYIPHKKYWCNYIPMPQPGLIFIGNSRPLSLDIFIAVYSWKLAQNRVCSINPLTDSSLYTNKLTSHKYVFLGISLGLQCIWMIFCSLDPQGLLLTYGIFFSQPWGIFFIASRNIMHCVWHPYVTQHTKMNNHGLLIMLLRKFSPSANFNEFSKL